MCKGACRTFLKDQTVEDCCRKAGQERPLHSSCTYVLAGGGRRMVEDHLYVALTAF